MGKLLDASLLCVIFAIVETFPKEPKCKCSQCDLRKDCEKCSEKEKCTSFHRIVEWVLCLRLENIVWHFFAPNNVGKG